MTFTQRCVSLFSVNFTTATSPLDGLGLTLKANFLLVGLEMASVGQALVDGPAKAHDQCYDEAESVKHISTGWAQELRDFKFGIVCQIGRWVSLCSSPKVKTWW